MLSVQKDCKETYLYVNGLRVARTIRLRDNVEICPASCSPTPDLMIELARNEIDLGITILFLPRVASQIRVAASTTEELVVGAWNAQWDTVLLSALFHCEVICNLQSNSSAEQLHRESMLGATNYHTRGLPMSEPRLISEEEALWIEKNFAAAWMLLAESQFETAVHCLFSYRWHANPRARFAVLWSGIEGLFGVDSEIVFRLSLYAARFLEPEDEMKRRQKFADVKRLYKQRSAAVHGAKIKGDASAGVEESAQLLMALIRRSIECKALPHPEELAP